MYFPRSSLLLLLALFACLCASNANEMVRDPVQNDAVEQSDGTILLKLLAGQDKVQARLLTEAEDNISFTVVRPNKDDLQPEKASHKVFFSYAKDCIMSWLWFAENFKLSKESGSTADINSDAVVILSNLDEKSFIKGSVGGKPAQDKIINDRCAVKNRVDSRFSPQFLLDFSMFRPANSIDFDATVVFGPAYKLYKEPTLEPPTDPAHSRTVNNLSGLKLPIWAIVLICVGGVAVLVSIICIICWCCCFKDGGLLHPLTMTSNRTSRNTTNTVDPKNEPVAVVVQPKPSHLQVKESKAKTAISKTEASRLKSITATETSFPIQKKPNVPKKMDETFQRKTSALIARRDAKRLRQETRDAMQAQMQDKEFVERRDSKASRYESVGSLEANSTIKPVPSNQSSKPLGTAKQFNMPFMRALSRKPVSDYQLKSTDSVDQTQDSNFSTQKTQLSQKDNGSKSPVE